MDTGNSLPLDASMARMGSSLNDQQAQFKNVSWSSCDAASAAAAASSDTLLNHMKNSLLNSQFSSATSFQGQGIPRIGSNLFLPQLPTQANSQQMMFGSSFSAGLPGMNISGNIFDHPLIKNPSSQPSHLQESMPNNNIMQNNGQRNTLSLLDESLDALLNDEAFGLDCDDFNPIMRQDPSLITSMMPKRAFPTEQNNMLSDVNKRQRTCYDQSSSRAPRFRPYQEKQWDEQFEELLKFKERTGHCLVPHTFEENQTLSRWVKRQRYQYKLMNEGKVTTMTESRVAKLEEMGFVWDSHAAAWQERLGELEEYLKKHGDVHVPSNYPENPQLATWVKCQRRQGKLYFNGRPSNMNRERVAALNRLGFSWGMRHGL